MNPDPSHLPQPDPQPASLESLERQLRALPAPQVPAHLPGKLIAAVSSAPATAGAAAGVWKLWPWYAALVGAGIVAAALTYTWVAHWSAKAVPAIKADGGDGKSAGRPAAGSSKGIQAYEQAIQVDPYNADAWFNLAKAQAQAHQSAEAISSAEKALDVARSRDRTDLVQAIETWLRSQRKSGGVR